MIYTSYFANLGKLPDNVVPISICAKNPGWYGGLHYYKLAPKYEVLYKWLTKHNEDDYIKEYTKTTLETLSIFKVLCYLQVMLYEEGYESQSPFWESPDLHVALICYEKPSEFCHRHLVAEWLRKDGIQCEEWASNKNT